MIEGGSLVAYLISLLDCLRPNFSVIVTVSLPVDWDRLTGATRKVADEPSLTVRRNSNTL